MSGRAELLQTQSADIGAVVDERQVRDLPLLGRRYAELALLTPGVVVAPAGITSRGEDTFFNANGNYATWNNYTLDGADNNSMSTNLQERSPQVVAPPVDALQEFKVQTRTYSAEFGKAAGAVINASVKQGTNQFRGTLFEFFRDEVAERQHVGQQPRRASRRARSTSTLLGGVLGGPLVRGRTFFFGDYQATRTERALSQTATVPTARMRAGDLSELTGHDERVESVRAGRLRRRGQQADQSDRASIRSPRGCIDALSAAQRAGRRILQQQLHLERHPQQRHRPVRRPRRPHAARRQRSDLLAATASRTPIGTSRRSSNDPVASGDFASDIFNRGQNLVGGWSRVFGASMFNEFRFGWNKVRSDSIHPAFGIDANAQYGIRGVPNDPRFYGGLPHMPIARFARLGGPFFRPQFQWSQVFQFADNLTVEHGPPRDEVRHRAPARPGHLHRRPVAQRRAELPRRPLHRVRARRFPARPVVDAAAVALPSAGSLQRRLAARTRRTRGGCRRR